MDDIIKALMAAMITMAATGILLIAASVLIAISHYDPCAPHPDPTTCTQLVWINGQWTCIPQDQAG